MTTTCVALFRNKSCMLRITLTFMTADMVLHGPETDAILDIFVQWHPMEDTHPEVIQFKCNADIEGLFWDN